MICNSYNQLTIVEKTQFVGRLIHIIQSEENAFNVADTLLKKADAEGWFDKVTILPTEDPNNVFEEAPVTQNNEVHQMYEVINSADFLRPHSNNVVSSLYYRTKNSLQRSYQKVFAKLAS